MKENTEGRNDWAMLGGVAVGAVIALAVGPPLVGGAAIGLCLGLLFAPKCGSETRRGIGEWTKTWAGKAKSAATPAAAPASATRLDAPPPPLPKTSPAPKTDAAPERALTETPALRSTGEKSHAP